MTETLLYERTSDGLAWITLNRSDALNAINMQMPHVILSADYVASLNCDLREGIRGGAYVRAQKSDSR